MKLSLLVLCLSLLAIQINGQCVITTAVSQWSSGCTSSAGCQLTANLLASLNTDLSCLISSLTTGASVVLAPTGSGQLNLQLGTGLTGFGISSYSNLNITANPGVVINAASNAALSLTNNLVLAGQTTLTVASGTVLSVGASLQVAAGATINVAGNVTAATAITIEGTVYLAGSKVDNEVQNAWVVLKNAGSISISGSASASAYVRGNGGFDGSVAFSGNATVAAGNSPGSVFVNGDLTMSHTTILEIEVDSFTSYDRLLIKKQFTRSGVLYAKFNNDYVPSSGAVFIFATHTSASGSFDISHGNYLDKTFTHVKPSYSAITTSFEYSSASSLVASLFMLAFCLLVVL